MLKQIIVFLLSIGSSLNIFSQSSQSIDQKTMDGKYMHNTELLNDFFKKLYNLELQKNGKINIVHIGDSHIQADFMTNVIRQSLQNRFGNAGYGFTFPYSLAKTNGTGIIKYESDENWSNSKLLTPISDSPIGLGGINLNTISPVFQIHLSASNAYQFNTIKLVYPGKKPPFGLAQLCSVKVKTSDPNPNTQPTIKQQTKGKMTYRHHTVKKGETIYQISKKYNITPTDLKKANKLSSNNLLVGKKLVIPQYVTASKNLKKTTTTLKKENTEKQLTIKKTDNIFTVTHTPYMSTFTCDNLLKDTYIIPVNDLPSYDLNGIVLEKNTPGIIYHSIGINGAKISDYNKYNLFFNQLSCLHPDLIIVSLGTNESFGNVSSTAYIKQVLLFIANIKEGNPDAKILFTTPSPSLLKKKKLNKYIQDYSTELLSLNNCTVWDCLSRMGGIKAPVSSQSNTLMAKDKVHYTREGYEMQGNLFVSDFLEAYEKYKQEQILNNY